LGTELGVSYASDGSSGGTWNFQIVGFHHALDDAVVRTTLPDRRFFRVNRDEIRTTGAELLGNWTPGGRGVFVTADLLLQDVKVRDQTIPDGDRKPEHQPKVRGGLELELPLFFRVEGSVAARYTGTQYCLHADLGEYQKLGSETVGNVGVERSWRVRSKGLLSTLKTMLFVDNLFDDAVYDQCGLPQPGRTLRFGMQLN
jgi:iron complex outermembrane recepter protein